MKTRREPPTPTAYSGRVGHRWTWEDCLVLKATPYSGYYGDGTRYTLEHRHADGTRGILVWWADYELPVCPVLKTGDKYTIVGTPTLHAEYGKVKQTTLTVESVS